MKMKTTLICILFVIITLTSNSFSFEISEKDIKEFVDKTFSVSKISEETTEREIPNIFSSDFYKESPRVVMRFVLHNTNKINTPDSLNILKKTYQEILKGLGITNNLDYQSNNYQEKALLLIIGKLYSKEIKEENTDFLYQEANRNFYIPEDYPCALTLYNIIYEIHQKNGIQNSQILANLGNIYFRLGKIGKSILFYKRALHYSSGDDYDKIFKDYKLAKEAIKTESKEIETSDIIKYTLWIYYFLPLNALVIISLISFTLFTVLLSMFFIKLMAPKKLLIPIIIVFVLFVVFLLCSVIKYKEEFNYNSAVIVNSNAKVMKNPSTVSKELFVVPEGFEIEVVQDLTIGENEKWYEITSSLGSGWVKENQIEKILLQ